MTKKKLRKRLTRLEDAFFDRQKDASHCYQLNRQLSGELNGAKKIAELCASRLANNEVAYNTAIEDLKQAQQINEIGEKQLKELQYNREVDLKYMEELKVDNQKLQTQLEQALNKKNYATAEQVAQWLHLNEYTSRTGTPDNWEHSLPMREAPPLYNIITGDIVSAALATQLSNTLIKGGLVKLLSGHHDQYLMIIENKLPEIIQLVRELA